MKNKYNLIFSRFYRKSAKYNLGLSCELEEIIIGLALGDLHIEKISPKNNTRLQFHQSNKNKEYIMHLFNLFEEYCGSAPKVFSSFDNRINKNKVYSSIKFSTFCLPCFNKFRDMFYNSYGIKFIPHNLEEILTSRGLAYWIMDDGYKSGKGFYLCTESYTLSDNEKLKEILTNKFNLKCGIHKHSNGHRLYIFSTSKERLLELVKPYLLDHFYYKLDLS
jgi:hypothetical protein